MIWPRIWRVPQGRSVEVLYSAIVAQSRRPAFYAAYRVPDTVLGRFDLIVLHLVLVMRRLGRPNAGQGGSEPAGQALFDRFCRDLDDNLREMGVGDLAVPKEMRRLGEAFYGRQAVYLAALAAPDDRELASALARNIFNASNAPEAPRLARYVREAGRVLEAQDETVLSRGQVEFPDPDTIVKANAQT